LSEELVPASDPWERLEVETAAEWTAFSEYCKLGPSRSIPKLASHLGVSRDTVKIYSRKNKWVERSKQLDIAANAFVPTDIDMSPTQTLAFQWTAGQIMLDLGVKAINLIKPGSIKVSDAIKLIDKGAELQRKAQGLDTPGMQISLNSKGFEAVEELFNRYIEGEVVDPLAEG